MISNGAISSSDGPEDTQSFDFIVAFVIGHVAALTDQLCRLKLALREQGIRVPEDVGVPGVADRETLHRYIRESEDVLGARLDTFREGPSSSSRPRGRDDEDERGGEDEAFIPAPEPEAPAPAPKRKGKAKEEGGGA